MIQEACDLFIKGVIVNGMGLDSDFFFDVAELKHWVLNDNLLNCSESFIMLLCPGEFGLANCELSQWC